MIYEKIKTFVMHVENIIVCTWLFITRDELFMEVIQENKEKKKMLNNCLNDLTTRLANFDIQNCLISINWDSDYQELNIHIKKINNSRFDISSFNDFDTHYNTEHADTSVYSQLINDNLKMSEMLRIYKFINDFKEEYKSKNLIQYPKPTWWQKFKYKHFNIDYYRTRVTNFQYNKVASNA